MEVHEVTLLTLSRVLEHAAVKQSLFALINTITTTILLRPGSCCSNRVKVATTAVGVLDPLLWSFLFFSSFLFSSTTRELIEGLCHPLLCTTRLLLLVRLCCQELLWSVVCSHVINGSSHADEVIVVVALPQLFYDNPFHIRCSNCRHPIAAAGSWPCCR